MEKTYKHTTHTEPQFDVLDLSYLQINNLKPHLSAGNFKLYLRRTQD